MADSNRLVSTAELKTDLLRAFAREEHKAQTYFDYDEDFDAIAISIIPLRSAVTVVHYIDRHVALLYRADDLQIVGIQVEAFERSFLPTHANVERIWKLSDRGVPMPQDFGDLHITVERIERNLSREVARAAESSLGEVGSELRQALEYA